MRKAFLLFIALFLCITACAPRQKKSTIPNVPRVQFPEKGLPKPPRANQTSMKLEGPDLKFQHADLKDALLTIGRTFNICVTASSTVDGYVTASFKEGAYLEDILTRVSSSVGGDFTLTESGCYFIDNVESEKLKQAVIIPLVRPPKEILGQLPEHLAKISKAGSNYSLIVTGTPAQVREIKRLLKTLNTLPKQISIEIFFIDISADDAQSLGMQWPGSIQLPGGGEWKFQTGGKPVLTGSMNASFSNFLKFLCDHNLAEIRSNPVIVGPEGETILIESETQKFYRLTGDLEHYPRIEKVGAKTFLKVTAYIIEGDDDEYEIDLYVEAQVSIMGQSTDTDMPEVITRKIQTKLRVKNGEIVPVGGLRAEIINEQKKKIPILGTIMPGIFSSSDSIKKTVDLSIAIRPVYFGN